MPPAEASSPLGRRFHGFVLQGLLAGDWTDWRTYREMRNITSHTYDEAKAVQVVAAIPDFLAEARALVERLQGGA